MFGVREGEVGVGIVGGGGVVIDCCRCWQISQSSTSGHVDIVDTFDTIDVVNGSSGGRDRRSMKVVEDDKLGVP